MFYRVIVIDAGHGGKDSAQLETVISKEHDLKDRSEYQDKL